MIKAYTMVGKCGYDNPVQMRLLTSNVLITCTDYLFLSEIAKKYLTCYTQQE